ncbi:AVAST type 3 anti-phage proein Avs3b [Leeia oryzae]|uniref:AVAST type 3 anti-phage proein Avs3b n=1 Tax=Leeia oryzae TaxID=356662 RepID=UPI000476FC7F|nr:AVAST type 3 anti-phage proein Avs3b [Leeia oryzae]
MELLERSRAVIEFGKRLVAQLKLGDDELAQWMAHVLAERIRDAENAHPEDKIVAQNSCAELVLRLWERRYNLPPRLRPLEKLEPLLRTLDTLDASNGPRFRFIPEPPAGVEVEDDIETMLDFAVKLDDAARVLVQHFLATAAENASEESKSWIQSAIDAEADVTLEVRIVDFVDGGLDYSSDVTQHAIEILQNKIQKLEIFATLATSHLADMRTKLTVLTGEANEIEPNDE